VKIETMKKALLILIAAILTASTNLSAEPYKDDFTKLIYADTYYPVAHIDPLLYDKFSMMERELQYLIYNDGDNTVPNHFCVVGYQFENEKTEVVVIWKEKNILFRWSGGDPEAARERFEWASSMLFARKIGQKNLYDRLPDPPYILGGDKLATRSGFNATITDCEHHGQQHVIEPFEPSVDEEE